MRNKLSSSWVTEDLFLFPENLKKKTHKNFIATFSHHHETFLCSTTCGEIYHQKIENIINFCYLFKFTKKITSTFWWLLKFTTKIKGVVYLGVLNAMNMETHHEKYDSEKIILMMIKLSIKLHKNAQKLTTETHHTENLTTLKNIRIANFKNPCGVSKLFWTIPIFRREKKSNQHQD